MTSFGLQIEDKTFFPALDQIDTQQLNRVQQEISRWRRGEIPPFLDLVTEDSTLETLKILKKWQKIICKRSEQLIIFGIGGSSLGGEMLVNGLRKNNGLPVRFYDNVDPGTLADLKGVCWKKTFLLVVSKSGGTAETLSQFLTTLPDLQKQLGKKLNRQVAVITENLTGDLAKIANSLALPIIKHPAVGGRFSALCVVGLLPAAVAGANVKKILDGAASMGKRCLNSDLNSNPALQGAVAQYLMTKAGKNISIYMSYGQKLDRVAAWQSQLWGESLGKTDPAGQAHGLTPVSARGVTDQHSQLQLYLDGPADKQFTLFFDPLTQTKGRDIGNKYKELPAVSSLAGRTTGALFSAEFFGTRDALINRQAPVRTFNMARGDCKAFGEMIILLESETALLAQFFGIDAYDQPAVEDGKIRAREYLAKSSDFI
ncbi:MAG: glucose-6-phosphate isomerase [Magnetococcales bacterium]|nr:glucose-6-phosphate isomerase [Magnetococcales bacterium]